MSMNKINWVFWGYIVLAVGFMVWFMPHLVEFMSQFAALDADFDDRRSMDNIYQN